MKGQNIKMPENIHIEYNPEEVASVTTPYLVTAIAMHKPTCTVYTLAKVIFALNDADAKDYMQNQLEKNILGAGAAPEIFQYTTYAEMLPPQTIELLRAYTHNTLRLEM